MTKFTKLALFLGVLIGVVIVVAIVQRRTSRDTIRYGISPYQDTAMPKVAEGMGLYQKNGLNVELVTVAWEDVVPSLASAERTVDVAIGSINTLIPRAENINVTGGRDVGL